MMALVAETTSLSSHFETIQSSSPVVPAMKLLTRFCICSFDFARFSITSMPRGVYVDFLITDYVNVEIKYESL